MATVKIQQLPKDLPAEQRTAARERNRLILARHAPEFVKLCEDLRAEGIPFTVQCLVQLPDEELNEINLATGCSTTLQ